MILLMAISSSRVITGSSSIYRDKNVGLLNQVHLKFAVSHVSSLLYNIANAAII